MSGATRQTVDWERAKERIAEGRNMLRASMSEGPRDAAETLEARARALASRKARGAAGKAAATSMLVFGIGEGRYALPLTTLSGVGPWQRPSSVPASHDALVGLFAVRSAVWAVYELARLMERDSGADSPDDGYVLFLKGTKRKIALRVDRLEHVAAVRDDAVTEAPRDMRHGAVASVGFWQDGVIVIDGERLRTHPAFSEGATK